MMTFPAFEAILQASFSNLSDVQLDRFLRLEAGYRDWNAKINVISRKDIDNLYDHHVLHSLAIAEYLRIHDPEVYSRLRDPRPRAEADHAAGCGHGRFRESPRHPLPCRYIHPLRFGRKKTRVAGKSRACWD